MHKKLEAEAVVMADEREANQNVPEAVEKRP